MPEGSSAFLSPTCGCEQNSRPDTQELLVDSFGTDLWIFMMEMGSTQSLIPAYLLTEVRVPSSEQILLGHLVEIRNQTLSSISVSGWKINSPSYQNVS